MGIRKKGDYGECRMCGRKLEHGKRVRASLSWEEIKPLYRSDGTSGHYVDSHSKSTVVCKQCAYEIAGRIGLERP